VIFVRVSLLIALLLLIARPLLAEETPAPQEPEVVGASDEYLSSMQAIRLPDGFRVEMFAAEPMVANPVAFGFDEKGRVFVCETFRQGKGVEDNRSHMDWLDDDLAAQTVEDRLAYLKKNLGDKVNDYTRHDDRLRLLEDTDGDGRADRASVFANRFNNILDGTGAGVLARKGNVYYTNIPELWLLRDEDGDGQAEVRKSLHHGYGVRYAFRGHDLHGLRIGPDGKLYFSVGDRGYNVSQGDNHFVNPDSGAVFRCNLDGSNLEVVATGLRNPQELAFDQFGNLFTGDNNSDGGDRARWVQVVESMDAGWRMYYQYLDDRGPWNQEQLWHPRHDGQAAYLVPPIANIADGPSGLTYDPGVGLPERWRNHFFLVDFRGGAPQSGIRAISVKPKGATFEIADSQEFIWSLLTTDVEFSPDGVLHATDWVEGWNGPGKGRILRFPTVDDVDRAARDQAARLIASGMQDLGEQLLRDLLAHPDMRVRLEAQFELAARPQAIKWFEEAFAAKTTELSQIHAIWGAGMLMPSEPRATEFVIGILSTSEDAELRAQAAKVIGDAPDAKAFDSLVKALGDDSLRVRAFAALALGKIGKADAAAPLLAMLEENADQDPVLRHAGVMGLAGSCPPEELVALAQQPTAAARIGVALALRRHASPLVARFLHDTEPLIVAEAARAIYDLPIHGAMEELAALGDQPGLSAPVQRRALHANFRLGRPEHAERVARIAANTATPEEVRIEALKALQDWAQPTGRDRFLGAWRPLGERDTAIAPAALKQVLASVFIGSDQVRRAAARAASRLGIEEVGPTLVALVHDANLAPSARAEALGSLAALNADELKPAVEFGLRDGTPEVRAAARTALARIDAGQAIVELQKALTAGEISERQAALADLAGIEDQQAEASIATALDELIAGSLPVELRLDAISAAESKGTDALRAKLKQYEESFAADDLLAPYRVALAGGDAERGQHIFFTRSEVSCQRCHKIRDRGGDVGPDLSKIAETKTREYLLESVLQPTAQIAKGYESIVLELTDGRVLTGVLRAETDEQVQLVTAEGKLLTIEKSEIEDRGGGPSAMPDTTSKYLNKSELRDLVEFLSTLK
jgi:quinoprotein glucose dehydrogenase